MTISRRKRHGAGPRTDIKRGSKSMFVAVKFRRRQPYWINPLSIFRSLYSNEHEEMQEKVDVLERALSQITERIKKKEGKKQQSCANEVKKKDDGNKSGDENHGKVLIVKEEKGKENDNQEEKKVVKGDHKNPELKKVEKETGKEGKKPKIPKEKKIHPEDAEKKDVGDVCVQPNKNITLTAEIENQNQPVPQEEQIPNQRLFESVVEKTVKRSIVSTLDKYVKNDIEKYIKKCVESSMRHYFVDKGQFSDVSNYSSISASIYNSFSNLNFIPSEPIGKELIEKAYPLTELSDASSMLVTKTFKVKSPSGLKNRYRLRSWSRRKGLHVSGNEPNEMYETIRNRNAASTTYIRQLMSKSDHLRRKFSLARIRKYSKMK